MSERIIVVLIFTAIFLKELFSLMPEGKYIDPFPFYDMRITAQSYFYFACAYVGMMIIAFIFTQVLTGFKIVAHDWFVLQAAEFIDYLLTYNTTWFAVFGIGVGITLIKFLILSSIITYKLCKT
jgi:hypothetical protein